MVLLGGGLMVEPACASLTVEPAEAFNLLIGWGGYGRAPPDLMVEHLKVLKKEQLRIHFFGKRP